MQFNSIFIFLEYDNLPKVTIFLAWEIVLIDIVSRIFHIANMRLAEKFAVI